MGEFIHTKGVVPMRISYKMIYGLTLIISMAALCGFSKPLYAAPDHIAADQSSAVILAYHRIGEDAYPETNLRSDQFLAHIQELSEGPYTILPLSRIIGAVKSGETLPPLSLAITFEGAYKSALEEAAPLLLERGIPFTVFYASDNLDAGAGQYISWRELKKLAAHEGVDIGILPASYTRLYASEKGEIRAQINRARQRYQEEFGHEAALFSYPFGELSAAYKEVVREQGFEAAFSLQSGALYTGADFTALPRFSMTEKYGTLERLRLVAHALPLPATDIEPEDPLLTSPEPLIGFTIDEKLAKSVSQLSCFVSSQADTTFEAVGQRIEMRIPPLGGAEGLNDERVRVNCTMPAGMNEETETRHWRWLGMLLLYKAGAIEQPQEQQESLPSSLPSSSPSSPAATLPQDELLLPQE